MNGGGRGGHGEQNEGWNTGSCFVMAEGWDGRVGGRLKREGNVCILIAEACCCRAEINTTL